MKNFIWLLFVVMAAFLLPACEVSREQKAPLPADKMSKLLLDLHLAEAYSIGLGDTVENSPRRFEKNYDSLAVFYTSVLQHHGTDLKQFQESLNWYQSRPGKMDTLYLTILENLLLEKSERNIPDLEPDQIPDEAGIHDNPEHHKQQLQAIEIEADSTTDNSSAEQKDE